MNQQQVAGQYRQSSTHGVHPVGLVVRLYDAIVEDLRLSLEAIRAGHIEPRTAAMNHALLIIAELESVLDHERGGQVARHLEGFYRVTRAMIFEANVRADAAQIEKLIGLFLPVRQAWQQVERDLVPGTIQTAPPQYQNLGASDGARCDRTGWSG
jgi:flagellar protein FliS